MALDTIFNPHTRKLDIIDDSTDVNIAWGDITGNLVDQIDLKNALDNKADIIHTHTVSEIIDFDTEVGNHPDVSGNTLLAHTRNMDEQLRGGLVDVDASGNTQITGELGYKVYIQPTEPTLTGNGKTAIWENTSNGLAFLIYRNSSGIQKLVEMS